ncbi:MAG: SET domain-containing protein-lysine N-methyltransferase [Verrucomicrobia bacterium]|jgi:hypothetical protein|nr:SET domain-containing protein-lysine N-methyltransferase [Verrucomicrobiota bacterium]
MLIIPTELRPSPVHGLGVFAVEPVAHGRVVSRFMPPFDTEYPADLLACLSAPERAYLRHFSYRSRFTGLYVLPGDHDRFMNHSDTPNVIMNPDGTATCLAARAIAAGEELTCDYRTFDSEWAMKLGRA